MTTITSLGYVELREQGANASFDINANLAWLARGAKLFSVKDRDLTAPPGGETEGDMYLCATSSTGVWATHDAQIARYNVNASGSYYFRTPREGDILRIEDENVFLYYDGSAWGTFLGALAVGSRTQTVSSASTVTPNADTNDRVIITALAAACQIMNPTNAGGLRYDGQKISIRIRDNGTARALTYDTQIRAAGGVLPTTTVISKLTRILLEFNAADTKWDCIAVAQEI